MLTFMHVDFSQSLFPLSRWREPKQKPPLKGIPLTHTLLAPNSELLGRFGKEAAAAAEARKLRLARSGW